METWSSVPADVEMESTEEGWVRTLFSDTTGRKKRVCKVGGECGEGKGVIQGIRTDRTSC